MVSPTHIERRRTKQEAAEELSELFRRGGCYIPVGTLIEVCEGHWSKVSLLAHAIHDDWKPVATAMDEAVRR
jgi:hypothetical protein